MHPVIEFNVEPLRRLCARYPVRRLAVFGSAVTEDFDEQTSDLDFLVDFQALPEGARADAFFDLKAALEELFQRPVDLVMRSAVRNPCFETGTHRMEKQLYAA
jgi:predicted nucleotidyltransferase